MAVSSQGFSAQAASTYVSVPTMTTVIQHRLNAQQSGVGVGTALGHQKLTASPAACAVTSGAPNFYIQTGNSHSHTPGPPPIPTPTPTSSAALQTNHSQGTGGGNSSCSLAKLQQLTNGLDMIPPGSCNTMTPSPTAMTLTPPPPSTHHPHAAMTPPPSHQMLQNHQGGVRNLTASPSGIPTNLQLAGYHKYYHHQPTNMNVNHHQLSGAVTPPIGGGQNLGRTGRNTAANVQHMQSAATSSRVSPGGVPNLISQYNPLNGYRMAAAAAQQTPPSAVTGYITNTAAGFTQQIPMQMGVMNMAAAAAAQTQYQDPGAIQRAAAAAAAAQQNPMYTTYGYINGGLMQSLNGTMRR